MLANLIFRVAVCGTSLVVGRARFLVGNGVLLRVFGNKELDLQLLSGAVDRRAVFLRALDARLGGFLQEHRFLGDRAADLVLELRTGLGACLDGVVVDLFLSLNGNLFAVDRHDLEFGLGSGNKAEGEYRSG